MAMISFEQAMYPATGMHLVRPDGCIIRGYFANSAVNPKTMPEGWNGYFIKTDSDTQSIFLSLGHDPVTVNCGGEFITPETVEELASEGSSINFAVDEEEWAMAHRTEDGTDDNIPDCPESHDSDWEYSFE